MRVLVSLIFALTGLLAAAEPFVKVPAKASARVNPLKIHPDAAVAGKKLFERYCAECHGAAGQGGKRAPALTWGGIQDATDGAVFWILTNGVVRHGMPAWSKIPEAQRWQIVSYLKSLDAIQ
jgi:mono/diheme cytochrome c family protein